eukprot:417137_1
MIWCKWPYHYFISDDSFVYSSKQTITCVNGFWTPLLRDCDAQRIGYMTGQYTGQLDKQRRYHGKGVVKYTNDAYHHTYAGTFEHGVRQGHGTYSFLKGKYHGDQYVGDFANGLSSGQGTYYWADGDKYVGNLENAMKNG